MKTPNEIKKVLEPCKDKSDCVWCEFAQQCDIESDALAYIQQLEKMLGESFARNAPALEAAYGLAEKVKKLESQAPKWISVEERLPETRGTYIAHIVHRYNKADSYSRVCIEYFDTEDMWISLHDVYEVTHWMPLPELPEV